MRQQTKRLLVLGLALIGVCASTIFAQDTNDKNGRDRMNNETTMTGCLNKDTATNSYMITDEKTGMKTPVTGSADLEKHANHRVTLTGKQTTQADGKTVFEASKIEHLSDTCQAPPS